MKRIKLCILFVLLLLLVSGCSQKSSLKAELETINISGELPPVRITGAKYLDEIDDYVYEQQLAACEMYIEAYELTKTTDFTEKYKGDVKADRVGYYCNERRKELQLDIATHLHDNIYVMVRSVEDCDNIAAYLKRVNYDAVNFYDYYNEFLNSGNEEEALREILVTFYEKSNILAFRFMEEYKEDIINAVLDKIESNLYEDESLNMYIAMNNEMIKAINSVYGGVPTEYSQQITNANISLARRMLEEDNDLSEETIDSLMYQLGEPTPEPEPTEEPTPEAEPESEREQKDENVPKLEPTPTPQPTPAPVKTPAPVRKTPQPAPTRTPAAPAATQKVVPAPAPVQPAPETTPQVYVFETD